MKNPRLPIAFLLMAAMAADLVVAVVFLVPGPHGLSTPGGTTMAVLEAMALSQVALLVIWISIGGRFELSTLRLAATAPVLIFWSRLFSHFAYGAPSGLELVVVAWAIIFLGQATLIAIPLLAARYVGLALEDEELEIARATPFQFSLQTLLLSTIGLAVFCGLMSWFVSYEVLQTLDANHVLPALAQGLGHGLIGLAGLWAVLGWGRSLWRYAAMLLSAATVWAVYSVVTFAPATPGKPQPQDYGPMLRMLTVVGVYTTLLVGSLWLVRLSGLRLRRGQLYGATRQQVP